MWRWSSTFNVEYIYGIVGWGGLQAKSMTSQRYRATYKMADMRYYGNVMTTTRWRLCVIILHLQQYSRRLNCFCCFFLNLDTRRGCVVSITPRPRLPPGKTRYTLYRRMGGPRSRSGKVRKISPHRASIPGPYSP